MNKFHWDKDMQTIQTSADCLLCVLWKDGWITLLHASFPTCQSSMSCCVIPIDPGGKAWSNAGVRGEACVFWIQNQDNAFDLNFICSPREPRLHKKKGNQEERSFAKALDWKSSFCCGLTVWPWESNLCHGCCLTIPSFLGCWPCPTWPPAACPGRRMSL